MLVRGPYQWAAAACALLGLGLAPVPEGVAWPALIAGSVAACGVTIAGAASRGRVDILELGVATALAYLLLFPVRALVVLLNLDGYVNVGVKVAPAGVQHLALAVAGFGFIGAGLAYNSRLPANLGAKVKLPAVGPLDEAPLWLAWLLWGGGFAATAAVVVTNQSGSNLIGGSGALSSAVSAAAVYLVAGLCLLTRRAARGAPFGRAQLAVAVLAVTALAAAGQFKEPAIVALLTVVLAWRFTRGYLHPRGMLLPVLAVIFVVFPLVQASRLASDRLGTKSPVSVLAAVPGQIWNHSLRGGGPRTMRPWTPVTEPLVAASARLYSYDTTVLSVWYTPSAIPFQDGRTLALVAAGLMPRVLWPGKPPVGLGVWWATNYWNTPFGQPEVPQAIGHPAELWIDFGFAGVLVGLTLLGFAYRFLFVATGPTRHALGMISYAVVFVTIIDVDRDLPFAYVTLGQRLTALAAPLVLWWAVNRVARRPGLRKPVA